MTMNTPYLSDNTTGFTSAVSVGSNLSASNLSCLGAAYFGGAATFAAAINSASAVSAGAITGTAVTATSTLTVGAGGQPLLFVGGSKTSVAALTITATKSVETTFTDNNAKVADLVVWGMGTSTSSVSAGLAVDTFVSAASTITIRFSNVSAANAAQAAISLSYGLFRF